MENIKHIEDIKGKDKLIEFFRSEIFVLCTFVAITIPLMWHTAFLLLKVSDINNTFYAWFFAFGFDLAIFTFAINGRKNEATGLAFGIFILNCCFFNLGAMYTMFGAEQIGSQLLVRLVVTVIISGMGSYIVHSYVVFFNDKIGTRDKIMDFYAQLYKKDNEIASLKKTISEGIEYKRKFDVLSVRYSELESSSISKQEEVNIESVVDQVDVPLNVLSVNAHDAPVNDVAPVDESAQIEFVDNKYVCMVFGCHNKSETMEGFNKLRRHCINKSCFKTNNQETQPGSLAVNG